MRRLSLLLVLAGALALAGCLGGSGDAGTSDAPDDVDAPDRNQAPPDPSDPSVYAPGWPSLEEADVRPGANVASGSCTSNFLFRSPTNRTLYLGTAAHCVTDKEIGDPVKVAGSYEGVLAYSSWKTQTRVDGEITNDDNDFALVALPNTFRDEIHPAVRDVGGPAGLATNVAQGDRVVAHGNSSLRPDPANPTRPQEGYVTDSGEWITSMYFAGPGIPGDSGSAVLTADGKALGVLVHLEILPQAGSNNAANLDAALAYANEHSTRTYQLVTWETLEDPALPSTG